MAFPSLRKAVTPLVLAFSTLTCLPLSTGRASTAQMRNSVVFYPLVGAALGGLLVLAGLCPLAEGPKAGLILALWVVLTMAFHLDGWADCLDGWFGGRTPLERRRIMKDAHLGTYGVTGIVLVLLLKFTFLETLLGSAGAWLWLLAVPTLARFCVVFSCLVGLPARREGLGAGVLGIPAGGFALSALLTAPLALLLRWEILGALALSLALSLAVLFISRSRIGGLTGDGLGATIELCETGLLFLACLRLA